MAETQGSRSVEQPGLQPASKRARKPRLSFRSQAVLLVGVSVVVAVGGLTTLEIRSSRARIIAARQETVGLIGRSLEQGAAEAFAQGGNVAVFRYFQKEEVPELARETGAEEVLIANSRGVILSHTDEKVIGTTYDSEEANLVLSTGEPVSRPEDGDSSKFAFARSIRLPGQPPGVFELEVSVPQLVVAVNEARRSALVSGLVVLLLALPMASYAARRLVIRSYERERRTEERFRSLVQNSSDIITIAQADTTIAYQTQSVEKVLGYEPDELLGTKLVSLTHPEDAPGLVACLKEIASSSHGANGSYVCRWKHRNDGWRQMHNVMTNLTDDANIEGVVVNTRDVTSQRALEDQLRQSQKMEAIGQLAGGVAHDFNNLMAVILNCATFLSEDIEKNDPKRKDVDEILKAGERASALTNQLLSFSRREIVKSEILDVNHVISGIKSLLLRTARENVEVRLDLFPVLNPTKIDRGQLEQIIMNLTVNAVDAMPEGGQVSLKTANVIVDEAASGRHPGLRPGEYVILAVSDTGPGMSPEAKARAFEPFFTTKPRGAGTGLGLSTVYGILQHAKGHVIIDNGADAGTTFTVYLPTTSVRVEEAPLPIDAPSQGEPSFRETILVAEDEDGVRSVVDRILSR
ncbi:MAG: PAS domain S-box protein, partial [Actinobacteria bacterium]|nr:PAS domain S-box protein [Actinomycetota bacterium]